MSVEGASIAVLIPAYNEVSQIGKVLIGLPDYVDHIVVIDDGSGDGTADAVRDVAVTTGGGDPMNTTIARVPFRSFA